MILAGDVGGTKANLGWFEVDGDRVRPRRVERLVSADYATLEDLLAAFVCGPDGLCDDEGRAADAVCLGIAGPVVDGRVQATNLPWHASEHALAERFDFPRVELVNDLVATAEGVPALEAGDVAPLVDGEALPGGTGLVVAAGTGFGAALLVDDGTGLRVAAPTEAGHVGYAPRGADELALVADLQRRHGRVSIEHVVSGEGIVVQYEHLAGEVGASGALPPEDDEFRRRWETEDRSELITAYAARGRSRRAALAVQRFVASYGAVTGDLALAAFALGGVWVAGGIAAGLEQELRSGVFRAAFTDKGPLRALVERIPVHLVREPRAALYGAARRGGRSVRPLARHG